MFSLLRLPGSLLKLKAKAYVLGIALAVPHAWSGDAKTSVAEGILRAGNVALCVMWPLSKFIATE